MSSAIGDVFVAYLTVCFIATSFFIFVFLFLWLICALFDFYFNRNTKSPFNKNGEK